jgi:uncharacterized Zn finger protein
MNCPSCGWPMQENLDSHKIKNNKIKFTVKCNDCDVKGKFTMNQNKYEIRRKQN